MTQAAGANSTLCYATEATYDTSPALVGRILPFASADIGVVQNQIESKVIKSTRDASKPGQGNYGIEGNIKTELNPFMELMFRHLLGTGVTAGSNPYTHTITVGDLPIGLSIGLTMNDLQSANRFFKYTGCRVNKCDIKWTSDGICEVTFGILGAQETVGAIPGTNFGSLPTSVGDHVPFSGMHIAAADAKVGGSQLNKLVEVNLSIMNSLDADVYVIGGAGKRQALPQGLVIVKGNVKALLDDSTYTSVYAIAAAGTASSLDFTFTQSASLKARMYMAEVLFGRSPLAISGAQGIYAEFPFIGYYSTGSDTTFKVIFTNTDSTDVTVV